MSSNDENSGLNIGALARATGVPVETLRTWERRYGFPNPARDDHGHRVYSVDLVEHITLVDAAIKSGQRASSAISLNLADLRKLYGDTMAIAPLVDINVVAVSKPENYIIQSWLQATKDYDGETLEGLFRRDWAKLGGLEFLRQRVRPFLEEIGQGWVERRLEVGHEHFASERVRDFLTTQWRPLSDRSKGPRIVCATLPGETHYLGLQMAATVLSLAGCRVIYLGSDTPVEDVVDAAHAHQTSAVCISISIAANRFMASRDLSLLRERLNPSVALVTGGLGAPEGLPGVELVPGLDALLEWGQNLIAHSNAARK